MEKVILSEAPVLFLSLASIFGLCIGSFVQACAYRIPRGLSIVFPSSSCPECKTKLAWYDNMPLLGWLFLKGRCRYCQSKIPPEYLLVEIIFSIVSAALFYVYVISGSSFDGYIYSYFFFTWFFLLAIIDFRFHRLPDVLTVLPLFLILCFDIPLKGKWDISLNLDKNFCVFICFSLFIPNMLLNSILKIVELLDGIDSEDKIILSLQKKRILNQEGNLCLKYWWGLWLVIVIVLLGMSFIADFQWGSKMVGYLGAWLLMYPVGFVVSKIVGETALGLGDIKYMACLGYVFGAVPMLIILLAGSFLASMLGLYDYLMRGKKSIPLGPFISIAAFWWLQYELLGYRLF